MPDALSQLLPSLKSFVTFLTGSGVFAAAAKLYNTYLKSDQQEHTQAMDLVQTLREDIDSLQARQDEVERQLAQSQRSEALLTAQVQLLIERIDTLLDRLDEYEPVSDADRKRYTSLPTLDPSA
jgi:peptidoglycan hydrolase CwlO-like protein